MSFLAPNNVFENEANRHPTNTDVQVKNVTQITANERAEYKEKNPLQQQKADKYTIGVSTSFG